MSPTYAREPAFARDFVKLADQQQSRFLTAVEAMVADLKAGRAFRTGLRVKRVQGWPGVWEMTWAPDGRATFEYGREQRQGEPHVIWRRVGTHGIFSQP